MNKKVKITVGVIVICVIAAMAFFIGYFVNNRSDTIESNGKAAGSSGDDNDLKYVVHDGVKYEYNTDIQSILFLGIDKKAEMQTQDNAGRGGQSDSIILFVLNKSDKTTTMLQISRNAMVDVDLYDISGNYQSTEKAQIALQYAYGDGKKKSCQLTKDAVSKLMFNIPIKSYAALNIDGISAINDAIGGVKLKVPEDYTSIDPAFVQGKTITMTGAQAEKYVRYRDTSVSGSNEGRMERQTQFLHALVSQAKSAAGEAGYDKIYSAADPYMVTDMSVDELKRLSDYKMTEDSLKVPGEEHSGVKHDEFSVDDGKLQELVLRTFYKPVTP